MCYRKMVIYYIYKIHFLCGFPSGRYYIGNHKHSGSLSNDKYGTCAWYIWRDENNPLNIEELYKFKFIGSKK